MHTLSDPVIILLALHTKELTRYRGVCVCVCVWIISTKVHSHWSLFPSRSPSFKQWPATFCSQLKVFFRAKSKRSTSLKFFPQVDRFMEEKLLDSGSEEQNKSKRQRSNRSFLRPEWGMSIVSIYSCMHISGFIHLRDFRLDFQLQLCHRQESKPTLNPVPCPQSTAVNKKDEPSTHGSCILLNDKIK